MGKSTRPCTIDGCDRFVAAHDMCSKHYYAARRSGVLGTRWGVCSVADCGRPVTVRGYCGGHYARVIKTGSPGDTPLVVQIRDRGCKVEGCERRHHKNGHCQVHSMHVEKHGAPRPVRKMAAFGEGSISRGGYRQMYRPGHPNSQANGLIPEHRLVMSDHLGRPLLDTEEVHHLNGDKLDNRLANLELWSHSQPPGQRVEDKLEWCRQFTDEHFMLDTAKTVAWCRAFVKRHGRKTS